MADNLGVNRSLPEVRNLPLLARGMVFDHIKDRLEKTDEHITFSEDEVYVVWFAFTLGNFKALCSTTLPDGRYYELTYSKDRGKAFIDTYVKINNTEIDLV